MKGGRKLAFGDESQLAVPNPFGDGAIPVPGPAQSSSARSVIGQVLRDVGLGAVVADSPLQTRAGFDPQNDEDDRALVDSLRANLKDRPNAHPQEIPVKLAPIPGTDTYVIVHGHRRVAALRCLGYPTVRAIIADESALEADLACLTENVRKNLSPLEQARALARLKERHNLEENGLTPQGIAKLVGLSDRYARMLQRLLETHPAVQDALEGRALSFKVALAIGQAAEEHQPALAGLCAANGLSEKETEDLVNRIHMTGQNPSEAAQALGLERANSDTRVDEHPDAVALREAQSNGIRRKRARNQALSREAARAMVGDLFPELEEGAAQELLAAAAKRPAGKEVVKIAGLLVTGGQPAAESVESALRLVKESGAQEILRSLQSWATLHQRLGQGRLHQDVLLLSAALAKKWSGLAKAHGKAARSEPRGRA